MPTPTVYINGRFTAQRVTGVQRVALNLLMALDVHLANKSKLSQRWILLLPPGGKAPQLSHIKVLNLPALPVLRSLHAWEQFVLPRAARRGLLLNFCASAPYFFGGPQFSMLHDAAIFDQPQAYSWVFRNWYGLVFRRIAAQAKHVFIPSEFSHRRLAATLDLAATPVTLVPGAAEHFDAIAEDSTVLAGFQLENVPFYLAVASQNPTKNLDRLIAAHAKFKLHESIPLVIVGGSNSNVFAGSKKPSSSSNVVFTGPISDEQLKALYKHALAFFFPSFYEGFGLPPLEAMRCACPVATADAASLPEVCRDAALYFDPYSDESIAACMARLAGDADLRASLRAAGLLRAEHFSWSASAAKIIQSLEAYEQTLS